MRECKYDKVADRYPVDSVLAVVDLRKAYVNHAVPSDVSGADLVYNEVEDPHALLTHPSDVFEGMRQADYVKSGVARSAVEAEPKAASSTD